MGGLVTPLVCVCLLCVSSASSDPNDMYHMAREFIRSGPIEEEKEEIAPTATDPQIRSHEPHAAAPKLIPPSAITYENSNVNMNAGGLAAPGSETSWTTRTRDLGDPEGVDSSATTLVSPMGAEPQAAQNLASDTKAATSPASQVPNWAQMWAMASFAVMPYLYWGAGLTAAAAVNTWGAASSHSSHPSSHKSSHESSSHHSHEHSKSHEPSLQQTPAHKPATTALQQASHHQQAFAVAHSTNVAQQRSIATAVEKQANFAPVAKAESALQGHSTSSAVGALESKLAHTDSEINDLTARLDYLKRQSTNLERQPEHDMEEEDQVSDVDVQLGNIAHDIAQAAELTATS